MNQEDFDRIKEIKVKVQEEILDLPGVHAVSIGYKRVKGIPTSTPCMIVHVLEKHNARKLKKREIIKNIVQGIPTDVIAHPRLEPFSSPDPSRYRPVKGGCQISATNSTGTGTLGAFVLNQQNEVCLLTASHVVKEQGVVFQPGSENPDPNDAIADIISGYSIINSSVDAAIAKIRAGVNWNNWVAEIGAVYGSYNIPTKDVDPLTGYSVQKRGAKTGLTYGYVAFLDMVMVEKDGRRVYGQYGISKYKNGVFGLGGDSGSVVLNEQNQVVALLIGGEPDGSLCYATPIQTVLDTLKITLCDLNMPLLHLVHDGPGDNKWVSEFTTQDGKNWTDDQLIPNSNDAYGTNGPPSLVMFQDNLVCVRQSRSNNDIWYSVFNGNQWGTDSHLSDFVTYGNPGLAVYKGVLYIIHQDGYGFQRLWCTQLLSVNGPIIIDSLIPNADNPYPASGSPALIVYNGKLYCVREVQENEQLWLWCAYFDGDTWNDYQMRDENGNPIGGNPFNHSGAPSLVFYNELIYCLNEYNGVIELHTSSDGLNWSNNEIIPLKATSSPTAIVYNNELYIFREVDGKIWCYKYNDNYDTDFMLKNNYNQVNGYLTYGPPAVAMLPPNSPPTILSFTPTSATVGTTITINGTNLNSTINVQFNGVDAGTVAVVSTTQIKVNVPSGATTGNITVINQSGSVTSTSVFFVL